jgi:hypothetical protein
MRVTNAQFFKFNANRRVHPQAQAAIEAAKRRAEKGIKDPPPPSTEAVQAALVKVGQ